MGAASSLVVLLLAVVLVALIPPSDAAGRTIGLPRSGGAQENGARRQLGKPDTLQVVGSSLPDCSHACGSCTPCRLVMVSFLCSSLEDAKPCPMAYKCMCHSKSYPVP